MRVLPTLCDPVDIWLVLHPDLQKPAGCAPWWMRWKKCFTAAEPAAPSARGPASVTMPAIKTVSSAAWPRPSRRVPLCPLPPSPTWHSPHLQQTLAELGYAAPTLVQASAIPVILAGRDLMAGAQTGTGKTAAFVLPLLEQLLQNPTNDAPSPIRALVLVPTRELAVQVHESVTRYAKGTDLTSTLVYGG